MSEVIQPRHYAPRDAALQQRRPGAIIEEPRTAGPRSPGSQAEAQRRVQRLVAIEAALGTTMQDLAALLNPSRPQLYKWLDPAQAVRLQDAKRQRLDSIDRLAKAGQARSAAPLRAVAHEPLANVRTVFELLAADAIDEPAMNPRTAVDPAQLLFSSTLARA